MTEYLFAGKRVHYLEYGAGAKILQCGGGAIADFPNHLDAEAFVDLLPQVPEITALRSPTFLEVMRESAVRAILAEEDKKFLEYVNRPIPQPVVEFFPNHRHMADTAQYAAIDGQAVQMGGNTASIEDQVCSIHGNQPHIYGYDDMGFAGIMPVCLKCCAAIYAAWRARDVTPEQKAEDGKIQSSRQ